MLILFLALLALAIPVCAIAGLMIALSARKRLDLMQKRLASIEAMLAGTSPVQPASTQQPVEAVRESESEIAPEPEVVTAPTKPSVPSVAATAPSQTAKPQAGLEERIGSRWAVWVGGLALALGGLFLVRYSIEQDLLGPVARIAAGFVFSALLLGAGEWLRRREEPLALPGFDAANVPGILTAAGTSTAFATTYAAYGLYDLIGPGFAFTLLGAVAALTMLASILHGPALAALGLVAALGSPLLVSSENPQPWVLVVYLGFTVLASYGVARLRLWRWLAMAGAVGALAWTGPIFLINLFDPLPAMVHLVVQIALAGVFLVAEPHRNASDEHARIDRFASAILFAFAVAAVLVSETIHASDGRPFFIGIVALILLVLGIRFAPAAPAVASAMFTVVGALTVWPIRHELQADPQSFFYDSGTDLFAVRPDALASYLTLAAALPLLIGAANLWRLARGRMLRLAIAVWYAGAASVGPLLVLVVAYWRVAAFERSLSFALIAGFLALFFLAATVWLRRQESETLDSVKLGVGACASAALAALALGLVFALDKGILTVAFALAAFGTAWVAERTGIPALRYAVGAIGLIVLGRLAWDPTIVSGSPGSTIIVNWLLWGYGVPALAFFLASRLLERQGRDRVVRFVESLSIVFAAFLVFFEIRHAVQGGDILAPTTDHLEFGLLVASSFAFSLLLVRTDASRPDAVYRYGSMIFKTISVVLAIGGLLLVNNPLFTGEKILGGAVVNSLLPAYLLPAILAVLLALQEKGVRPPVYAWISAILGLLLQLTYMVLEIRRIFQGPAIGFWRETGQSEQWTYSVALLVCGMALLALGLLKDIRFARMASAVYLLLAVLKVFIIDLANLEGVMRALSFIGLGLVLIGIGLVYQKFLIQRPTPRFGGPE